MSIPYTTATEIVERARTGAIRVHFQLTTTPDRYVLELERHDDGVFVLVSSWYNTDCVGPSHGETTREELDAEGLAERLSELVVEPFEIIDG